MQNNAPNARVLVVDLDETLCRTDTLHEALFQLVVAKPLTAARLMFKATGPRPAFKAQVADHMIADPDCLPFNASVIELVKQARAEGRKTALVSASDQRQVSAVAAHLGLFDEAIGTNGEDTNGDNLGGYAKAALLVARFGEGQFDYIGDCARDLPIWSLAHTAYVVSPTPKLMSQAEAKGLSLSDVPDPDTVKPKWRHVLRALRPHQWSKNILVFLPMLASQNTGALMLALMAFILFSLTASSVYLINDLVDLPSDRKHARKCKRPFAAGLVPLSEGIFLAIALILGSAVLAIALMPPLFWAMLLVYFLATLAYSFVLKRKLIIDVVTLAGLYTMRILAGAAATSIVPSPWLLAFSMFLFFSLATIKRQGELIDQVAQGKDTTPGRGYLASDAIVMQIMSISAGQAAVLVFALYLYSPAVSALYQTPEVLWLICPILLYWLSRMAILTHRGFMNDDPIVFTAKDRISWITVVVVSFIVFAAERSW